MPKGWSPALRTPSRLPLGLRADQWLFAQLCISIWVSICNGGIFIFGLMSPTLKAPPFSYDQRQVALVSTVGAITSYVSLPTGYLFDRFGPRPTLIVGGVVSAVGWLSLYFLFRFELSTSVAAVSVCYGICQLSASFYETGSLLTNLEAFRLQQGRVVILQKTFMGLGSSLIATYYSGFFGSNLPGFFLFLAVFNAFWAAVGAYFIRLPTVELAAPGLNCAEPAPARNPSDENSPLNSEVSSPVSAVARRNEEVAVRYDRAFRVGFVCLAATIALLLGAALATTFSHLSSGAESAIGVAALILPFTFWSMLAFLPREMSQASTGCTAPEIPPPPPGENDESPSEVAAASVESVASTAGSHGLILNASGLLHNLQTIDLWLLWYISLCVWGASTVVSGNGAQIYKSLDFAGYSKEENDVFVSVFGVASAIGRIAIGGLHAVLQRRGRHISFVFPIAPVIMAVAMPLFLVLPSHALIVPFFGCGLATGFSWATTVLVMKSLFTANNVGKHYNVLYTAGMLTPVLFSVWMFAGFYDKESQAQNRSATHDCDGTNCVLPSLLILMALNLSAVGAALAFYRRVTRRHGLRSPTDPLTC